MAERGHRGGGLTRAGRGPRRAGPAAGKRAGVWDSGGETVSLTGPLLMPDIQQEQSVRYVWSGENRIQDAPELRLRRPRRERQVSTGLTVEAEIVLENCGGGVDIVLPCGSLSWTAWPPPARRRLSCSSVRRAYKTQLKADKKIQGVGALHPVRHRREDCRALRYDPDVWMQKIFCWNRAK